MIDAYTLQQTIIALWQYSVYIVNFIVLITAFYFLIVFLFERKRLKPANLKRWPKVSIIIPCYNEEENIEETVKSLMKIDYPKNKLEILVIDDGSTDRTYEIARRLAKKIKNMKVFRKFQGGKASTVNFGIKKSTGQLIMVLDADTKLARNTLKKMVRLIMSDKKVMSVIPSLIPQNTNNIIEKWQDVEYRIMNFTRLVLNLKNILNITPAASLYKKEFFKKYGFFDEKNLTEDFEMGMRIISNGYNVLISDAKAYTKVPSTFKQLKRQRVRWSFGHLVTLMKYKKLFFKRMFGDLGNFYLPISFLNVPLLAWFFLLSLLTMVINAYVFLVNLNLIGYDWGYALRFDMSFSLDNFMISLLNVNYRVFWISVLLTVLTLLVTKKITRFRRRHLIYIATFYLFYVWLILYFYFETIAKILMRKKIGW